MKYFILILAIVLLLPSCVRKYGLAEQTFQTRTLTIPYKDATDTTKPSAFYFGGNYERALGNLIIPLGFLSPAAYDDYYAVHLNTHFAKQYEHMYYAAGLTGYKGVLDLQSIDIREVRGDKNFWGVGATGELGMAMRTEQANWRPAGLKLSAFMEKGEYADFRSNVLDTVVGFISYRDYNPHDFIFNISMTSGVSFNFDDFFLDLSIIGGISNETMPYSFNVAMAYRKLGIHFNFTQDLAFGRSGFHAGLQYQF